MKKTETWRSGGGQRRICQRGSYRIRGLNGSPWFQNV